MAMIKAKSLLLMAPLLLVGAVARADNIVETTIPFPFMVQQHELPAGKYRIERSAVNPSVLVIRGESGTHAMLVAPTMEAPGEDPAGGQSALVFVKQGGAYHLKDVWENQVEGQEIVVANR